MLESDIRSVTNEEPGRRASMRRRRARWAAPRLSLCSSFALCSLIASCAAKGPESAGTRSCGGETTTALDCASNVHYDGIKTSGGGSILNIGSAQAAYEDTALRQIDEQVERYVAAATQLCKEYNACVVDALTYRSESERLRAQLTGIRQAVAQLGEAQSVGTRKAALAELYQTAVPEQARGEQFDLALTLEVELPAGVSSGPRGARFRLRPNEPVPTGAFLSFVFDVSQDAHLYVFQDSPETGPTTLFPDERIGTRNPLGAAQQSRIGPFEVTDKDYGTEWAYLVAARQPLPELGAELAKISAGQLTAITDASPLGVFKRMAPGVADSGCAAWTPGTAGAGCVRTRGLVLANQGPQGPSLAARTEAGDSLIVKKFPYLHVKAADYAAALAQYDAPTDEGQRTRGVIMEE